MKLKLKSLTVKFSLPLLVLFLGVGALLTVLPSRVVKGKWLANNLSIVDCDVATVTNDINIELKNVDAIGRSMVDFYSAMYQSGISDYLLNLICNSATADLGADEISLYDAKGVKISPDKYSSNSTFNDTAKKALSGQKVSELRIEGPYLIAISALPVYVNNQIIGCIEVGKNLSTPEFMGRYPNYLGCEFTSLKMMFVFRQQLKVSRIQKLVKLFMHL